MFETISHTHQLLANHSHHAAQLHHATQKLNLVGSNTEVYNSYGSGGANEGGNFDHSDHVTAWSPYYTARPIDSAGLTAEGGPGGIAPDHLDTFACDNDGFGCYLYNYQAFDHIPDLLTANGASLGDAGSVIGNQDTAAIYTSFGVGAENRHTNKGMENIPFFYPPRQAGKLPGGVKVVGGPVAKKGKKPGATGGDDEEGSPDIAPPKFCPAWADCTGTGNFHLGEGYDG